MGVKQKVLAGTLVSSTIVVLVGSLLVFPPMIIIGGVGIGLSLRKRLFFKKKKNKKQVIQTEVVEKKKEPLLLTSGQIDSFKY